MSARSYLLYFFKEYTQAYILKAIPGANSDVHIYTTITILIYAINSFQ
jgi:hypothetical protein